jgi:hypothetical protein
MVFSFNRQNDWNVHILSLSLTSIVLCSTNLQSYKTIFVYYSEFRCRNYCKRRKCPFDNLLCKLWRLWWIFGDVTFYEILEKSMLTVRRREGVSRLGHSRWKEIISSMKTKRSNGSRKKNCIGSESNGQLVPLPLAVKGTVSPVWDGLKMAWFNRAFPVDGPLGVSKISS